MSCDINSGSCWHYCNKHQLLWDEDKHDHEPTTCPVARAAEMMRERCAREADLYERESEAKREKWTVDGRTHYCPDASEWAYAARQVAGRIRALGIEETND